MIFQKQIEKIYRSQLFVRQDNPYGIFYFSPEDFPGLSARPYTFRAKAGHELKGYFYHYGDPIPGRLVVFDHGMGNGHRAYMKEIERLARGGYLVFSYDHTGCMESGGESTNGFAQSLSDLDACLTALKGEAALKDRSISVVGHSWGGFSTLNIAALHRDVTHVVALSGFVSVELMVKQNFGGVLKPFAPSIMALETRANPGYVGYDAVQSLKNTGAKVLLVYSADDKMVRKAPHYDVLHEALADQAHVEFLLLDGKNHNPTYSDDAVKYKDGFFGEFSAAVKKKLLETPRQQEAFMARYDWERMTQQDEAVWQTILDALNQ